MLAEQWFRRNAERDSTETVAENACLTALRQPRQQWNATTWQVYFGERAGIAEFDHGHSRADAEWHAYIACVHAFMMRNLPAAREDGGCLNCKGDVGKPDLVLVPCDYGEVGHVHAHCVDGLRRLRIDNAMRALDLIGVPYPKSDNTKETGQ